MNNKTIIYVIIIIIIILAAAGYYYWKTLPPQTQETPEEQQKEEPEEVSLRPLVMDDFEIQIPEDWQTMDAPEGIKTLIINSLEQPIDPENEKPGFRSYLAVTFDKRLGKTDTEFVEYVKSVLKDSLPEIEFGEETPLTIDGRKATALEALIPQDGYRFKALLVIINGEGEDMWTLSFNTSEIRWDSFKDTFFKVADTFKLK